MATIEAQTIHLAQMHYDVDETVREIYRIESSGDNATSPVIRLLEVTSITPASGIMPIAFSPIPDRGVLFPSVIIEVTPDEIEKIRSAELKLPEGLSLGELIPSAHAAAAG